MFNKSAGGKMPEEKKKYITILITRETHDRLDKLKIHRREPYEDVIKRLLEEYAKFKEGA